MMKKASKSRCQSNVGVGFASNSNEYLNGLSCVTITELVKTMEYYRQVNIIGYRNQRETVACYLLVLKIVTYPFKAAKKLSELTFRFKILPEPKSVSLISSIKAAPESEDSGFLTKINDFENTMAHSFSSVIYNAE